MKNVCYISLDCHLGSGDPSLCNISIHGRSQGMEGGAGCNRNTQLMITSPSHSLCKKTETYKHYNASEPSLINKYGPITSVPALYLITAGAIIIYLSDKSCQDIYSNISPTSHDLKLPELKNNNPLITLQAPSSKSSKLNRKNEKKKTKA